MSTIQHPVTLSPAQVAILVESLTVCLNSDTFLDDVTTYREAEDLLLKLRHLP